jgi:hypothetical protein
MKTISSASEFYSAFKDYRDRTGISIANFAIEARVSTRVLIFFARGELGTDLATCSQKKIWGLKASLTRIAPYLELDPENIFEALGLPLQDGWLEKNARRKGASLDPPGWRDQDIAPLLRQLAQDELVTVGNLDAHLTYLREFYRLMGNPIPANVLAPLVQNRIKGRP